MELKLVLRVGLEPTRISPPVPKTGVAAITPPEHCTTGADNED
jgi:hypothetical protein